MQLSENGKKARNTVLNMLNDTFEKGMFIRTVEEKYISSGEFDRRDTAFIRRMYIGVIERSIFIDKCIDQVSNVSVTKMKPVILNILRMGIYQLFFMDNVPDHAAIGESARLAGYRGFARLVPFVNGVLRSVQREGYEKLCSYMTEYEILSVPKWIWDMVCIQYGKENAKEFFNEALESDTRLTVCLNRRKMDPEAIIEALGKEDCDLVWADEGSNSFYMTFKGALTSLEGFKKGLFWVQDISSVRAALAGCKAIYKEISKGVLCGSNTREKAIQDNADLLIVDVCASPGGKSICAAEYFPASQIISRDISQAKVELINENAKRLGLCNIKTQVHDALVYDESLNEKADLVIADLPCSGLGVIRHKPDIKLRLKENDLQSLSKLQRDILSVVYQYVKKGGIMLYSTCTVNKDENIQNAKWCAARYGFEILEQEQVLTGGRDGFYICVMKRTR